MFASIRQMFTNIRHDTKGATAIEYGLIAAMLAVAMVAILPTAGENLKGTFTKVSTELAKGN